MTRRNEQTSAKVAKIAGRILAIKAKRDACTYIWTVFRDHLHIIKWSDIRALAASALTQTRDHADAKVMRSGKIPEKHKLVKRHKPVVRNHRARVR